METKKRTPDEDNGVIARLKKHKAEHTGTNETILPETSIKVTWPKFQPHSVWMRAQRAAKKNPLSTSDIYVTMVCKFDGERLTLDEFKQLVPTGDVLHLTGEVLGEGFDDEDDEGNGQG